MGTYERIFKCTESITNLYEDAIKLKDNISNNIQFVTNLFTKNNIETIISLSSDKVITDEIEKLKKLKTIIDQIIINTNIQKIKFDLYNKEITEEVGVNPLDKLIIHDTYNKPEYLYYYTLDENSKKPLPYHKLLLLSLKICPVHFYLNDILTSLYKKIYKYSIFMDCFFEIKDMPYFFIEYCSNLGLHGVTILDIEIILGLLTKLLLIDLTEGTYPEYDSKTGKIIKIKNVFDIVFKWKFIDISKVLNNTILSTIAKLANLKYDIANEIDGIIDILFNILTKEHKDECFKLYKSGLMTISIYIAYIIKSLKSTLPILSFSHLGYLDDISTLIINNANDNLEHIQKGGLMGINNIIGAAGIYGTLKQLGIISIIGMIYDSLKKPIYACAKSFYSMYSLELSNNMSFIDLTNKFEKLGDNIIINIINGTSTQPKLTYLSMFLKTFRINTEITKLDKLLLIPNICSDNKKNTKTNNNKLINELIKSINYIDTSFLTVDILYLIFSENSSLFKIYDRLINNLFVKCEDYKFNDEIDRLIKVVFSFINKISPHTQHLLRQKILSYIIIQNIISLADKYKKDKNNNDYFYTMSNTIDPHKVVLFDNNVYKLCKIIISIICVKPTKHDTHLDNINEFILACLGRQNKLFDTELIELLEKLVNYNFKHYREYVMASKIAIVKKALLFTNIQPKPKKVSNNSQPKQNNAKPKQNNSQPKQNNSQPIQNNAKPIQNNSQPIQNNAKPIQNNATAHVESEYETSFFVYNIFSDIAKMTKGITTKSYETAVNKYNAAKEFVVSMLTTPEPDLNQIVILDNAITQDVKNEENKSKETISEETISEISKPIDNALEAVDKSYEKFIVNDNYITNKQKVHLFVSKLFEYVLYVSYINIETKLHYTITDNIIICDETDIILKHLLREDTDLLFETPKQKSKIRFITY